MSEVKEGDKVSSASEVARSNLSIEGSAVKFEDIGMAAVGRKEGPEPSSAPLEEDLKF